MNLFRAGLLLLCFSLMPFGPKLLADEHNAAVRMADEQELRSSRMKAAASKADFIFVGLVIKVGEPPAYKSGRFPAFQIVQYKVERNIKGRLPLDSQIEVHYSIVSGGALEDPSPAKSALSGEIFYIGNRLIIFASKRSTYVEATDSDFGTILATDDNVHAIEALLEPSPESKCQDEQDYN